MTGTTHPSDPPYGPRSDRSEEAPEWAEGHVVRLYVC
jgi:hypothetical protein